MTSVEYITGAPVLYTKKLIIIMFKFLYINMTIPIYRSHDHLITPLSL